MIRQRNTKLKKLTEEEKLQHRREQQAESKRRKRKEKQTVTVDMADELTRKTGMTLGELRKSLIEKYGVNLEGLEQFKPKPLEGKELLDLEYTIQEEELEYKPKKKKSKDAFESVQENRKVIFPWKHTNASELSKLTWTFADRMYALHKEHPEYKHIKLKCVVDLEYKVDLSPSAAQSIHIAFTVDNWIPTEDPEWITFKREFDEKKKKS